MSVINGTAGSDPLTGGIDDDVINGLDGNDTLDGGTGGVDTLNGGTGSDLIYVRSDDIADGGDGDDTLVVSGDLPATLTGGVGNDTLRFDGSYDISGSVISGIENVYINGTGYMTTAQLGSFGSVGGYSPAYTSAYVALTKGGTATVNLSATLTSLFQLYGSTQADIITFSAAHLYSINAFMGTGNDKVISGAGNDSLRGDEGNDSLLGGAGNDSLDGGDGRDVLTAGTGDDFIVMRTGDVATGAAGNDLFSVYDVQQASIDGGADNDSLRFEGSYDISSATIIGVENALLYGNNSMTTAQFDAFALISGYSAGYTTAQVYLTKGGTASVVLSSTLSAYFQLYGSGDADLITFNAGYAGTIYAFMGLGDDRVTSGVGNDTLRGDDGNDSLFGAAGNDSLDGGAGRDSLDGGSGFDYLVARANDTVLGGTNDDLISVAENLPASIDGGTGSDTLRFEGNLDITGTTIVGVENLNLYGNDSMTAAQLDAFAFVQGYGPGYTSGTIVLTQGGTATVSMSPSMTGILTLYGSTTADVVTFNYVHLGAFSVYAGSGNDSITAASGADTLRGDAGNDSLYGQLGTDYLDGGSDVDRLEGGAGDDTLIARAFDNLFGGVNDDLLSVTESSPAMLDGGGGRDTLRFENTYDVTGSSLVGIEVLALNGTPVMTMTQLETFLQVTGYSVGYTYASLRVSEGGTASVNLDSTLSSSFTMYGSSMIEILSFNTNYRGALSIYAGFGADQITGAAGNDYLRGEGGSDSLVGLDGNDTMEGASGADTLNGGAGIDVYYGGTGRDTFAFSANNSSGAASPDRIQDFEGAGSTTGDLINLSAIDADGGLGVNDAFIFGSSGLGGLSVVDSGTDTLVRMNIDGDPAFEIVILIADGAVTAATYTAADFVL